MKKKYIVLLVILLLLAATAFWFIKTKEKTEPVAFVTIQPQYGYISKSITATGTIQPVDTVSVGAQVSGVIKNVFVDYNSVVKKGQLLAKVDASILTAQQDQSKANLASAESNLAFQESTYERQSQLFRLGAISKADYQLALSQYNNAMAAKDNAGAQLRVIQKTLSYTDIYSPVAGVVLNRNVSEGQTIASSFNAPVLFVIAKDLTRMRVNAAVDEADIGGVKNGQNVSFTVDAFPNDVFLGQVQEILLHPSVSANVVTYTTHINVDNQDLKLKPGMTASINIYIDEDSNALLIPSRALTFKPDSSLAGNFKIIRATKDTAAFPNKDNQSKSIARSISNSIPIDANSRRSYVWVKTGDTLTEKKIVTGINDDSYVKVIKGLLPDDEVITNTVTGNGKASVDNAQRSPFMPQMRRRSSTTPRN